MCWCDIDIFGSILVSACDSSHTELGLAQKWHSFADFYVVDYLYFRVMKFPRKSPETYPRIYGCNGHLAFRFEELVGRAARTGDCRRHFAPGARGAARSWGEIQKIYESAHSREKYAKMHDYFMINHPNLVFVLEFPSWVGKMMQNSRELHLKKTNGGRRFHQGVTCRPNFFFYTWGSAYIVNYRTETLYERYTRTS